MTPSADLWARHLAPGERIVWSAAASQAMRNAERNRQRMIHGLIGAASLVIAFFLLARFVESFLLVTAQPSMLAAFTPLYLVFGLAMGTLAVWGFRRMGARGPAATHFAATDSRLLALDATGALTDQMPGAEVDGVIAGGRRETPDIYVLRKDDPKEERVFAIEHIDRPLEAKAIIEETFLDAEQSTRQQNPPVP